MFRNAKPGEFTFKRDDRGVETVEHQGLIFATMRGPNHLDYVDPMIDDGPFTNMMVRAIDKARSAGFWVSGRPDVSMPPVSVTVQA